MIEFNEDRPQNSLGDPTIQEASENLPKTPNLSCPFDGEAYEVAATHRACVSPLSRAGIPVVPLLGKVCTDNDGWPA